MSSEVSSSSPKSFNIGLVGVSVLCWLIFIGAERYFGELLTPLAFWVSLGCFAAVALIGFHIQKAVVGGRPAQLANRFMAVTMLKLFVAITLFIAMILLIDRSEAIAYTAVFIGLYVIFSVFLSYHSSRLDVRPKG